MRLDKEKLRSKGWSEEEIAQTAKVFDKASEHKTHQRREKTTITVAITIIFIATAIAVWAVEPILLIANATEGKIAISITGILLGLLLVKLEKDIEILDHKHHLFISILVPVVAITASIIIATQANAAISAMNTTTQTNITEIQANETANITHTPTHNPFSIGLFFSTGCILPFLIHIMRTRKTT